MTLPGSSPKPRRPRLFLLRRVMGDSMLPTLRPGMVVVGVRPREVQAGDIVIFRHNKLDKIKRVKDIRPNEIFLTGDNYLHSTDSRSFGWLDLSLVIAKVVWPRRPR